MPDARPAPPAYARAIRWRVAALSLWLGRMALAPFGLAPYIEPLLAVPVAIGLVGAALGPWALGRSHPLAAAGEAIALAFACVPALGWLRLSYGAAPTSDAALPIGTDPLWLPAAALTWLAALALTGHRCHAIRPAAWLPSAALLTLDLPPLHRLVFALSPRLAEVLAPLAMVLAIFALARFEKAITGRAPMPSTP